MESTVFVIGLALGAAMLLSVCFVFIRHQRFGVGGGFLCGFGVILVGMSVWQNIDVTVDATGFQAELQRLRSEVREARQTAETTRESTLEVAETVQSLQRNLEVRTVQEQLSKAGIYDGAVDGSLGPATKQALVQFQRQQQIEPTGEVNERTLQALRVTPTPTLRIRPELRQPILRLENNGTSQ